MRFDLTPALEYFLTKNSNNYLEPNTKQTSFDIRIVL